MASSSRRSYDTDTITLRTVFAKNGANSNIPALRVLTADGTGSCYWAIPSSLGMNPSFNQIITTAATYTADLSFNRFRLLAGEGIGMVDGAPGSNATTLYAKAFNTIDVSGDNGIAAFSNGNLNATVNLAGGGSVQVRSDPATNTIFIEGPTNAFISTGVYGFHQFKFIDGASTILSDTYTSPGTFITANSPSTVLNFVGVGDLLISTQTTYNTAFLSISTFTSKGYLAISGEAFSAYPSSLSTVSSLYAQTSQLLSVSQYFSSAVDWGYSSFISTINFLAMSTGSNFYITTGLINQTAADFAEALASNTSYTHSTFYSTIGGLGNIFVSTATLDAVLTSTVASLDIKKYNIVSSLYASQTYSITGTQKAFMDGTDMYFSSFAFSLSSFSSYITDQSQVFIQQNPNFVFSDYVAPLPPALQFDFPMQSYLTIDNVVNFPDSQIDSFVPISITSLQSNYWTGPFLFPFATNDVLTNIQSNFVIQHRLPAGYADPNVLNEGLSLSTVYIHGGGFNTVFVHIYNS